MLIKSSYNYTNFSYNHKFQKIIPKNHKFNIFNTNWKKKISTIDKKGNLFIVVTNTI